MSIVDLEDASKREALSALRAWLASALAEGRHEEAMEAVVALAGQLMDRATEAELRLELERRQRSGRRTEKISAAQLSMLMELLGEEDEARDEALIADEDGDDEDGGEAAKAKEEGSTEKRRPKRKGLPEHLPRDVHRHDLADDQMGCGGCGGKLAHIGDDESETLGMIPAQFIVHKHVVAKYACPKCKDGVTTAPHPSRPVSGGFAEPSLLAHIVCSKFLEHIPLSRQHGIYLRHGVDIPTSTLSDQIAAVAALLAPIVERIKERALGAHIVQADASGLKVLDRDHPDGIYKGTMWCYVGDRKHVVFEYAQTGKGDDGPWRFLAGREGYVQADADNTFDRLFNGLVARAIEAGCWAHARRKLFVLRDSDFRVAWPLSLIGKLFRIERRATRAELDAEARRAMRREKSRPVLDALKAWYVRTAAGEPPTSALASACQYAINHWDALTRFLDDGNISLTNNFCELQIRSLAVGRKNYLFAGSDRGAESAAAIYTVLRTAVLHGADPYAYVADVLDKLANGWLESRRDELLPDAWVAARAAAAEAEAEAA